MNREPTSKTYQSQRLRLHYLDWGNEGAPPLVLIHGTRDHAHNWDWVARELCDEFHVLAVDLRGHGDSDWTNSGAYALDEFVFDLSQLVKERDLAPLSLIGHSLGGIIVLRYAGILPENVSKLVAIEGMGRPPPHVPRSQPGSTHDKYRNWLGKMHDLVDTPYKNQPSLEAAIQRMQEANSHLSPERVRHLTEHGVKQNEDGTYRWKFDHYIYARMNTPKGVDLEVSREMWSNITCPTLLVRGLDSWTSDPKEVGETEYFQNARVVNVENAGHWVHHDQLDEFLNVTKPFLTD
ncbi:MAG: alpha/beta hydrolase [Rhodospirillales bacterium]|jgi:pimeloyl-ACP methyl ester carboxylesterase|nr:alpha/beta hydrolase [Rhodospirillales bacterium]